MQAYSLDSTINNKTVYMMRHFIKNFVLSASALALVCSLGSCDTKEDNPKIDQREVERKEKEAAIQNIAQQFVEKTAIVTYTQLAGSAEKLSEKLLELERSPSQQLINEAAALYKETRAWWEKTEAFLFGPADYFGIDPFIDTWPLDENTYASVLASPKLQEMISEHKLDADMANSYLDEESDAASVLGFHAIEFTLFHEGNPIELSSITERDKKLAYAAIVGQELYRRCCQLQIGWGGENLNPKRAALLKEAGLPYLNAVTQKPYGELLKTADKALFSSWEQVAISIIDGSIEIVNEVATAKIQTAYDHANEGDANYIESPYSYNSRQDFMDNIKGVKNVYFGGLDEAGVANRDESKSLHAYVAKAQPELDKKISSAIDNAIAKIQAIPQPFKNNATAPEVAKAIEACGELSKSLEEAKQVFKLQ